jgi:hypothetical protein
MVGKTGSSVPVVVVIYAYLSPLMVGKTGSSVPVVVIYAYLSPLMVGKTGSSVPVVVIYAYFVTPHGREDWVKYISGSNTPTCAYGQLITPHGSCQES